MRVDGNGDVKSGRLPAKWILVTAMLTLLGVTVFLFGSFVTTVECPIAPAFLLNRSDQAIERLTVSVVYLDYAEDVWSGRLEAGQTRIIGFPMWPVDGYTGEGRMAYSGLWSDGRPIPEASGPAYLTAFPYNHALVADVSPERIVAATVAESLAPIIGGGRFSGLSWFVDQASIVLFCWLNWLFEPLGMVLVVMMAGLISWRLWRRRKLKKTSA